MIDKASKVGMQCEVAREAEILESILEDQIFVDQYTRVLHSQLGEHVRLERCNSILFSKMGRFSYTGPNTTIRNAKTGNFDSISWNVSIGGNTHDLNRVTTHSFLVYPKWGMGGDGNWESASQPCVIENDVWIGAGVNILRGVTVGSGAVIGAGTVVTKDVPPYAIVVGNPGKVIRMRCKDEIIEKMLELKWWNFPTEVIRQHFELFHAELTMDVVRQLFEIKEKIK